MPALSTLLLGCLRVWLGSLLVGLAVLALPMGASRAAVLEGQNFDDDIQMQEARLRLNGLGLRGVAWIKAFVAGLYVRQPTTDAAAILQDAGAKRLRLKILLEAPAAELSKAIRGGVRKNTTPEESAKLAARLDDLDQRILAVGTVHVGDVIDLDWRPGSGLVLDVNGQSRGPAIGGYDLYRSILMIFIGDRPVDKRMRAGLLAGVPASASGASAASESAR